MKAIRLHEFGPAENLVLDTVPDPEPGPGQVRIAVRAAGVHLIDTVLRAGAYDGGVMKPPVLPTIPGREVAGVVASLGEGVDASWLGAAVVTHLGQAPGGYAELAVRDVAAVHRLPREVDFGKAVAMIGTGRTALGVLELAKPAREDVVLVTGASGGIGTLVVQYARGLGATVVGAAGGEDKTARVRDNGADLAVDYTRPDWTTTVTRALAGRQITLALLGGRGGEVARAAFGLVADGGRVVTYGGGLDEADQPPKAELAARGISVDTPLGPFLMNRPGGIRGLEERSLTLLVEGRLDPAVQSFPLVGAAAAHAALEGHRTAGKVVLLP